MTFSLKPLKIAVCLGLAALALVLANIAGIVSKYYLDHDYVFGLISLFSLDVEHNIPSLFASLLLILCAGVLGLITAVRKRSKEKDYRYWLGLMLIFLLLAVDESVALHEKLIIPLRETLGTSGVLYFPWVIPYVGFLLLVTLVYFRFVIRLPSRTRTLSIFSAVIFVAGAIGLELLGAHLYTSNNLQGGVLYMTSATCEEALEMTGVLLYIYTLLDYIQRELAGVVLVISPAEFKN